MKPLIYTFPGDESFVRSLTRTSEMQIGNFEWRHFPDGESLITLQDDCAGREVILCCSLTNADTKTLPLYFLSTTARELGAKRVGLIAPYLAYMRQDQRFHTGQSRSAHSYAELLSMMFDWLVTVDPHLHRTPSLDEIYSIPTIAVSAMPAVAEWITNNVDNPIMIGPDAESSQWVERVAQMIDSPRIVLEKVRHGDRQVEVSLLDPEIVRGRTPVVLDDIASSGRTFIEVLNHLRRAGIDGAICIAVHALFVGNAVDDLRAAGAGRIVSTNTVPHRTNEIDVAALVSEAVARSILKTSS